MAKQRTVLLLLLAFAAFTFFLYTRQRQLRENPHVPLSSGPGSVTVDTGSFECADSEQLYPQRNASCKCTHAADAYTDTFLLFRLSNTERFGVASSPCLCNALAPVSSDMHIVAATLVKDKESWGKERSLIHYLLMLISHSDTDSHKHTLPLSLALLVSDRNEYNSIIEQLQHIYLNGKKPKNSAVDCTVMKWIREKLNLQMMIVIYEHDEHSIDRSMRHLIGVQVKRRRNIARLRNQVVSNTFLNIQKLPLETTLRQNSPLLPLRLPQPTHFLWIDADILHIPRWDDIAAILTRKDADIATIRCTHLHYGVDYDLNSWVGGRTKPSAEQLENMKNGKDDYTPMPIDGTKFLASFMTDFTDMSQDEIQRRRRENWVKLDSVGGTFLVVKAEVFMDGVMFPTFNVVGTEWDRVEGYDGIETEGLCYVARTLGYQCWGLPDLTSEHDAS